MLVHLGEQVIPPLNQFALLLVINQLDLLRGPQLFDIVDEVLKDGLSTGLSQDVLHNLVTSEQVSFPKVSQYKVRLFCTDPELGQQVFPVLGLDRVLTELAKDVVDLLVVFELGQVGFVDLVASHAPWEVLHFIHLCVKSLFDCAVHIHLEWSLIDLVDDSPDISD